MRTGWPRWMSCFARRPWRWLVPKAGINGRAPIITGARRQRSSPSAGGAGKVALGVRVGATETAVVCTELLQGLRARGVALDGRVLWVIDGGKRLRKALGDVRGDAAVTQRCHLHKGRNLDALVPKAR